MKTVVSSSSWFRAEFANHIGELMIETDPETGLPSASKLRELEVWYGPPMKITKVKRVETTTTSILWDANCYTFMESRSKNEIA